MSAVFAAINRNKRGVALDLQRAEGVRILLDLAARSDVLVENFVPGVADRLGIGFEAARTRNPGIV
jgi:crotonobetainyl-CoA:carnitine CoA-transferase CaiB-like acyl-CoA transferase